MNNNNKLTAAAKELLAFPCSPYTMESDIRMLESNLTCEEITAINELASMHWTPRDNFYGAFRPLVNMRGNILEELRKNFIFSEKREVRISVPHEKYGAVHLVAETNELRPHVINVWLQFGRGKCIEIFEMEKDEDDNGEDFAKTIKVNILASKQKSLVKRFFTDEKINEFASLACKL